MLRDSHGREIDYLRIAVTDRCNLRCTYCMPAEGIKYVERSELLSYEEILVITDIMVASGIKKIRITGGEPFVRKDLMSLLEAIVERHPSIELHITTNGTMIGPYISRLEELGISGINFSLDTLQKEKFFAITRRDEFEIVYENLKRLILSKIRVKVNCVVMSQQNLDSVVEMIELSKEHDLDVRFIEEMPFNGVADVEKVYWTAEQLEGFIASEYPEIQMIKAGANSSARMFKIPGYKGRVGIIDAFSRTFCGTCNRIRLNAKGEIITCLYGKGEKSIRDLLRAGKSREFIRSAIEEVVHSKYKNGFEAEVKSRANSNLFESMSTIGG